MSDFPLDLGAFLGAARELLAVPSTADRPERLEEALRFVIGFVGDGPTGGGFTVERFESGGKPSALVYGGAARPRFRVILNAHLDVVPAPGEQFQARLEGDRLHARGAADMKVSALVLALVFRELAGRLPYPIGLQLVTDEEVGGRDGTLHQLERGVEADFAVIGEQSALRVVTDSKGIAVADLRAEGRAAHGAYPWLGGNALTGLLRSVGRVLARYPEPAEETWRTTVTVSRVHTPNEARNQIPAAADAWLDIRFPPGDADFDGRSADEVARHLAAFCEPGVTPVVHRIDPPHHADAGHPDVRLLQAAARLQGFDGGLLRKHGSADGRFYYGRGVPAVIFGVTGEGQHGPHEYADVTSIAPYHAALVHFLTHLS